MEMISESIYSRYYKWKRNPMQSYQVEYYNICAGHMQWINGRDNERPDVWVSDIGLAAVRREYPEWEWAIRCAIEYIRAKSPPQCLV